VRPESQSLQRRALRGFVDKLQPRSFLLRGLAQRVLLGRADGTPE
jgi:hypothetical protein